MKKLIKIITLSLLFTSTVSIAEYKENNVKK
jgi:hypothetical protein